MGRYELHARLAHGGMATVYLGRMRSPAGLARTVAIKRMHPHFAEDPAFAAMFFDEARLGMRLQHPNIVPIFDVISADGELLLVMEYVHGESLSGLLREGSRAGAPVPAAIASAVLCGVLEGLHAAHETRSEGGGALGIVHRDVSPQNIVVGADGVARLLDFGVAKAAGRLQATLEGQIKGKLGYMAPEQLSGFEVDRRADVYAAAVVLWEMLTGERAFGGDAPPDVIRSVLSRDVPAPSSIVPELSRSLDDVVMRGMARDKTSRYPGAREMVAALERAIPPASASAVGAWVAVRAADALARRVAIIAQFEGASAGPTQPSKIVAPDEAPTAAATTPLGTAVLARGSDDRRSPARRWAWTAVATVVVGVPLAIFGRHGVARSSTIGDVHGLPAVTTLPAPAAAASHELDDTAGDAARTVAPTSSMAIASPIQAPSRSPLRPAPRPRAPIRPAAGGDCSDPFVIVGGIRVPREECFRKKP